MAFWWATLGQFIYDFQTLIGGLLAIGAALYAGAPVWRQLRDSNLQTRILHRETLATMLGAHEERYGRIESQLSKLFNDIDWASVGHEGEPIEVDPNAAHSLGQMVSGCIDWYLVGLMNTESQEIEQGKAHLHKALNDLYVVLDEACAYSSRDQHCEDYSIPDDEWRALGIRESAASLEVAGVASAARKSWRSLKVVQQRHLAHLRSQIRNLELSIAKVRN